MRSLTACVVLVGTIELAAAQPAPTVSAPGATSPAPPAPAPPGPPTTGAAGKPKPQQKLDDWDDETSDFDKLKTPDSPAFVILGVSPTEIQRPTTPKGLAVALGAFVSGADVTLPKNFALEVAPFWLFSHPDLDFRRYRAQGWERLYRTFSISLGTAQASRTTVDAMGMTTPHVDSDVGVGARTILFQGGGGRDDECAKQANAYGEQLASAVVLGAAELEAIGREHQPGTPEFDAAIKKAVEAKLDQAAKSFAATPKCIAAAASARGISVDLAGALDLHVVDSKPTRDNSSLAAKAIWLNASYDTDALATVAMVRYASRDTTTGLERVLDEGVRAIYKAKTFAVSAEGLARYRWNVAQDPWTFKVDVGAEYEISGDTWISVTFGKDFAFSPGDAGSLFSLANLKWGMSRSKIGGK